MEFKIGKTLSGTTLTCDRCTCMAGEQLAGAPRWWTPAGQKGAMQGGAAGRGVQKSGHTGWGRSRGPGSAGASLGKWPRRRPVAGPGTSSRETPDSRTSRPGSADRHWSTGWCGGPSLSPLSCSLFSPFCHFLLTSRSLATATYTQQVSTDLFWLHEQKWMKNETRLERAPSPLSGESNTTWFGRFLSTVGSSAAQPYFQ